MVNGSLRVAYVMDPLLKINLKKDSTLGLMYSADELGFENYYVTSEGLYLKQGVVWIKGQRAHLKKDENITCLLDEPCEMQASFFDLILMRLDPPVGFNYFCVTYLLAMAEQEGVLVLNPPSALQRWNEKLAAQCFPQLTPPTTVTSDKEILNDFISMHQETVIKPLNKMGGEDIYFLKANDPNIPVILNHITKAGTEKVLIQRFLPALCASGDKRIMLINGDPLAHVLVRYPPTHHLRANLAAGGTGIVQALTDDDRLLCAKIKPWILAEGFWMVGLDVIDGFITEINFTSPTCLREIENTTEEPVFLQCWAGIQQRLDLKRSIR